jgi:hypothetical protein
MTAIGSSGELAVISATHRVKIKVYGKTECSDSRYGRGVEVKARARFPEVTDALNDSFVLGR